MPYFALFDDAVSGRAKRYQNHVESRFFRPEELDALDGALQSGWQKGLHSVLFADYGFGLPLTGVESERGGNLALHWFANCADIDAESWLARHSDGLPAGISTPQPSVSETDYLDRIRQIHEAIRRGDTYQINYTTRLHLQAYGNPVSLYRRLRQPVPYAVLSHLPDAEGQSAWTLCFSPELFLKIGSDGTISTEPMKGTAPILGDGQDERRAAELQADPKNRAENVMIVDLLRNDLGKIAQTGTVCVPEPFKVSRFGSVWQMTSTIQAQALPHTSFADILRAAFPCGSITGAPKKMSMQIIESLEAEARGLYTGSIGYLNPCSGGLGFEGTFNVVIRTLSLTPLSDGIYQGVYGVGSGIVIDSDPAAEYRECGWKARFLNELRPDFGIFETLRAENGRCTLLDRHLCRLKTSAQALNLPLPDGCENQIKQYIADLPDGAFRVKALLASDGISLSRAVLNRLTDKQRVIISPAVLPAQNYLRRFKTTCRALFDQAWQTAETQGAFDSLFFNSDGILLEGGRSNVFIKHRGQWLTPSLDLDILNGIMRQAVLDEPQKYLQTNQVIETHITQKTLQEAEEIRLSNALRGVFAAALA
ncbi:TPA: bifunctional anthranilate synthase component I family protein/aminotransferase class IV [Neisseria meningitidis]|jgi:Anthranilate/para-aminobenzoate synthases component I|uniref:Para-aminobenzoate synthetase component I/4-amino-4-deoxychorismate lyase n=2 Tax=Neisseria meningitidis serogroup B TaxID=491 RepID=Q9JXM6_NEIMB|nr:bifunctional anthranilate synthase component I family protein/class IV aminotransferase [Neisseria meningitidis]AJC63118.1 para-aminobenzoate synthase [Neisseria meningitidis LNP21362]AAF42299.1 putative para-aminobenzoate synthetase component I/4-amino-4-deoxychorismate lyase [Neisseria meningitidis MC58]ADY96473.1 aminodeoxychorismate synthase [Neisseria meningitidis H44/76]ARC06965.1 bifunctional aminodeoxychorismate synthase component I/aminodeoxychorismate lyase [Neisseria meningitidis]